MRHGRSGGPWRSAGSWQLPARTTPSGAVGERNPRISTALSSADDLGLEGDDPDLDLGPGLPRRHDDRDLSGATAIEQRWHVGEGLGLDIAEVDRFDETEIYAIDRDLRARLSLDRRYRADLGRAERVVGEPIAGSHGIRATRDVTGRNLIDPRLVTGSRQRHRVGGHLGQRERRLGGEAEGLPGRPHIGELDRIRGRQAYALDH